MLAGMQNFSFVVKGVLEPARLWHVTEGGV